MIILQVIIGMLAIIGAVVVLGVAKIAWDAYRNPQWWF